jgi:hypothetical protein
MLRGYGFKPIHGASVFKDTFLNQVSPGGSLNYQIYRIDVAVHGFVGHAPN